MGTRHKKTPARLKVSLSEESQDLLKLGVELRVCESETAETGLGLALGWMDKWMDGGG